MRGKRSSAGQADLAAVGMAGENQIHSGGGQSRGGLREMRQGNGKPVWCGLFQGGGNVITYSAGPMQAGKLKLGVQDDGFIMQDAHAQRA